MPGAEITLLSAEGTPLARGYSDQRYNFVHLLHPEVGDCHEAEAAAMTSTTGRTAWQECFAQLSSWIPQWAAEVHQVSIRDGDCTYDNIPVTIKSFNSEWLVWWVPLPHVGGKPYTYYSMTVRVPEQLCRPD